MRAEAAFGAADRLALVVALPADGPPPSEALEIERRVAAFELSEESAVRLEGAAGPYALTLSLRGGALRLAFSDADGRPAPPLEADAAALAPLVGEYHALCEAYREAVAHLPPARIEALDQERRRAHYEASVVLAAAFAPRLTLDAATARRLFTLVCAYGEDALAAARGR